jgi:hypothetical protein
VAENNTAPHINDEKHLYGVDERRNSGQPRNLGSYGGESVAEMGESNPVAGELNTAEPRVLNGPPYADLTAHNKDAVTINTRPIIPISKSATSK